LNDLNFNLEVKPSRIVGGFCYKILQLEVTVAPWTCDIRRQVWWTKLDHVSSLLDCSGTNRFTEHGGIMETYL